MSCVCCSRCYCCYVVVVVIGVGVGVVIGVLRVVCAVVGGAFLVFGSVLVLFVVVVFVLLVLV